MDSLIVNKSIICGILMSPPQFDYMSDGTLICRMTPMTTEYWTKHDEEYNNPDVKCHQSHAVLAFGRLTELAFTRITA